MRDWVEFVAERLGPWSLWGMDFSPNDARLVRLERRPGGWKPVWWERADGSAVEDWAVKHRLGSRGLRVALGGFPLYHVSPESDDPSLPPILPEDLERAVEPRSNPRWDFWWRPASLARTLQDSGIDAPDSVHAASVMLPGLLEPASCPPVWIAARVLARCAQIWFLRGDRIERFLELDGGREDPALLGAEWSTLREELSSEFPSWSEAPISYLESSGAELLPHEAFALVDPPWNKPAASFPDGMKFACSAALSLGEGAMEEALDGTLVTDAHGRRDAARWILRALAVAAVIAAASACLLLDAVRVRLKTESVRTEIGKNRDVLRILDQARDRTERIQRGEGSFQASGGPFAPRVAALSRCWPEGAWIEDWSGQRMQDRMDQSISAWSSSGPDGVSRCLEGLSEGLKIQSTETWSPERWAQGKQDRIPSSLLHLGIVAGNP